MNREDYLSKKVGIIGGGQLGKMMINEAAKLGIFTIILDPSEDCPAATLANDNIIASFDDKEALKELAKRVDVITCEFEHISTEALQELEDAGYVVYPKAKSLRIIQNKYNQKIELKNNNIPLGDFLKVDSTESIKEAAKEFGYPIMLKSALGGYDGKGNSLIRTVDEVEMAYNELRGDKNPLFVEKFIPFIKEISVLCCITKEGQTTVYPVAENVHRDSILFETTVPAAISKSVEEKAMDVAKAVCKVFETAGMFCIEMFLTESDEILVNEVAPRPHNSGHYTIEGCVTSQFENHIRAMVGLPLGSTELLRPTVMRNLLGETGYVGDTLVEGTYDALSIEGVSLHIYGKKETKPQRKMGHITVVAQTVEEAKEKASKAYDYIKVIAQD
jgi:5-(carboxyamino)imidazole ribonucleotide synthase